MAIGALVLPHLPAIMAACGARRRAGRVRRPRISPRSAALAGPRRYGLASAPWRAGPRSSPTPTRDPPRILHEDGNPAHRLRVEHDARTLLVHLSGEDGDGWTVIAVDRATRRHAVAEGRRQIDAAREAYERLYAPD